MFSNEIHWTPMSFVTTALHPDTVEFSPDGHFIVCGTYQLDEVSQVRRGGLCVFASDNLGSFHMYRTTSCSGILDLSWVDASGVVAAQADGRMSIWRLAESGLTPTFSEVSTHTLLSVEACHNKIVCSDSKGVVYVYAYPDDVPVLLNSFQAHNFEAWCVTLDFSQDNIVYSGGDDNSCHIWDLRAPCRPTHTLRHSMGVCSVRSHPLKPHFFSTGSYDEHLRVWDIRTFCSTTNVRNPVPIFDCHVGGGVWRHKWDTDRWILVAGMHAGFAIAGPLDLNSPSDMSLTTRPAATYRTSAELAYGADWFRRTDGSYSVVTCSFYDNVVDFSKLLLPTL